MSNVPFMRLVSSFLMPYYPKEHQKRSSLGTTAALWLSVLAFAAIAYIAYLDAGCDTVGIMTEAGKICL